MKIVITTKDPREFREVKEQLKASIINLEDFEKGKDKKIKVKLGYLIFDDVQLNLSNKLK